jgi:site-specific DNA-methyltransferase (adenine-specific)
MARAKKPKKTWQSIDGTSMLYRGDQLAVMQTLPDESFDCIWTDPPYFLSNNGTTCVAGQRVPVNKGKWDSSNGIEADHEFNLAWLEQCYRLLTPAGTIWVSGTQHVYFSVGMALQQLGYRLLNDIVWEKPNPPPNLGCRCFTHATEMLLWATKAVKGSRDRYTFNYQEMKLVEQCLSASTNPGDLVFDPFAGSGTTGVAALNLKRRFVGCEIAADYSKLAAKRLAAADEETASTDVT